MNCTAIRNRLLACEQPDFPPPEVREHLADCAACRAVQQRVVQLEQQIVALPVLPSDGRAAFVLRFLAGDEAGGSPARRPGPRLKDNVRRKVALAFALAAGLAIFALGWWAWRQAEPTPTPPVVAVGSRLPDRQAQLRQKLEGAQTPAERVQRLADLAEELQKEALDHQKDADRLADVARFCVQVVREDLLKYAREYAREVPQAKRKDLLTAVAVRLQRIESEASRLATELKAEKAASAAASFGKIASAARDADDCLLALARGESA
jgi:hypothetical protein